MSLNRIRLFLFFLLTMSKVYAEPPVEVISSCIHSKAIRPSVTFTELASPGYVSEDDECKNPFVAPIDDNSSFNVGAVNCSDGAYLILAGQRLKLKDAVNKSMNHSVTPGSPIQAQDDWAEIDFNNQNYICVNGSVGSMGNSNGIPQYYIVENALGSNPVLYFYFFDDDILKM